MAVTNLVKDQEEDHVLRIARFAAGAIAAANETLIDIEDPSKGYVNIRVGFHSGVSRQLTEGIRSSRFSAFN